MVHTTFFFCVLGDITKLWYKNRQSRSMTKIVEWEVAELNFSHRNIKIMTTDSENSLEIHEGQQKIFSTSNDTKKKPEKDGQEEQRYDKSKLTPLGRRPTKSRIITIAVVLIKEQGVQLHIRFLSTGILHQEEELLGSLTLKMVWLAYQKADDSTKHMLCFLNMLTEFYTFLVPVQGQ